MLFWSVCVVTEQSLLVSLTSTRTRQLILLNERAAFQPIWHFPVADIFLTHAIGNGASGTLIAIISL
jgi:hypothetical protein